MAVWQFQCNIIPVKENMIGGIKVNEKIKKSYIN